MSEQQGMNEPDVMEPTFWRKKGWSARVVKNEDDDGWAVEIYKAGLAEPVLISPWVMGRDKKTPKPFDDSAFATFVKTASEVLQRSAGQRDAALKRRLEIAWDGRWMSVTLELVPDEYDAHALLTAVDESGQTLASFRVPTDFKFNRDSMNAWVQGGFEEPAGIRR